MTLTVIKRDGRVVSFNKEKIKMAIEKAYISTYGFLEEKDKQVARAITAKIVKKCEKRDTSIDIEEIQDEVEKNLLKEDTNVAREYIGYRNRRTALRGSPIDKTVEEILSGDNEYWSTENSNKNAKVVTTQRDYLAGALSTDLTNRKLLPPDIVKADAEGIIHFHDKDYFAQNALTNCELVNLEDMLQNGTMINNVLIEKPHRFITACTIATQIILAVTSSTYGGCTITLSHLAPFVRDSYFYHLSKMKELNIKEEEAHKIAKSLTLKEVNDGVQTFNYQINSMTNTNGQAPFLSINMYLGETKEYKKELALIIEQFLSQRILGFKNEQGVYVTPAFPKLLYVLEEDNINPDAPYYYLTELAAKCTAKRMVPDYISEKQMKTLKIDGAGRGNCYPCMGCRSFLTPDKTGNGYGNVARAKNYNPGESKYYGRLTTI